MKAIAIGLSFLLSSAGGQAAPACKPPPAKVRIKVNLKPDTEVTDLIAWYANLSCTTVVVASAVATTGKKVTLHSPNAMTLAEIERLFVAALESVGLAVESEGKVLYVIEAASARRGKAPVVTPR